MKVQTQFGPGQLVRHRILRARMGETGLLETDAITDQEAIIEEVVLSRKLVNNGMCLMLIEYVILCFQTRARVRVTEDQLVSNDPLFDQNTLFWADPNPPQQQTTAPLHVVGEVLDSDGNKKTLVQPLRGQEDQQP